MTEISSAPPGDCNTPLTIPRALDRNLPPATYTQLFGAEPTLAAVLALLADSSAAGVVCLEGPGGSGKAAVAHACAAGLAGQALPYFQDIVWETLRPPAALGPQLSSLSRPTSTLDRLLDAIALQLGYVELVKLEFAKKEASLRARLKSAPYLVAIENFEAVADGLSLVESLASLANPTKFLLTSRPQALLSGPVSVVPVRALDDTEALAFLRYLAIQRDLPNLLHANDGDLLTLQRLSAGKPLALQLVAGLAAGRTAPALVAELQRLGPVDAGDFSWLYGQAWSALSADARWLLVRLLALPSTGGDAESVYTLAQLPPDRQTAALAELWRAALLMVSSTLPRTYRLHGMTQQFVVAEGEAEVEALHAGQGVFREAVTLAGHHLAAALRGRAGAEPLPSVDRARCLEVLETCLDCDEVSEVTTGLVLALHPDMVRAGLWRLWHDYILRAVEMARQHQDHTALGYMLMCRAELLSLTGDLELAMTRWQEAGQHLAGSGDDDALARLECQWAKTCLPLGQWDKARSLLEKALGRAEQLYNPRLLAEVHHRLGDWYAKQSQTPPALEALERAQRFAVEARWPRKEAEIWQTMALAAFQIGDWPAAKTRLEMALALVAGKPEGALPGQLHSNLGLVEIYLGDLEAAGRDLACGQALAAGLGDELTVRSCLNNLGIVAYEQGRWAEARGYFVRALDISEQLGDIATKIGQLGNLGMLAVCQREAEAALPYLREAAQLATALNKVPEQAETEMWLSEAHQTLGRADLALELSQHALTLTQTIGHKALMVQICLRRGAWLGEQANLAEALACLQLALTAASPASWEANTLRVLAEIGRVHLQAGAATALQEVLAEMARLASENEDPRVLVVYHQFLGDVALAQPDYAGFCHHYGQALAIASSVDNDWFKMLHRETHTRLQKLLTQLDPAARGDCEARLAA